MGFFGFFSKKPPAAPAPAGLPFSEDQFRDLIQRAEEKELKLRLPDLKGKKVLEMAPRQKTFGALLKEKGGAFLVRLGGTREKALDDPAAPDTFILSHWESLPFLDSSVDFILLRSEFLKMNLGRVLRESGRILDSGGSVLLCDLHPFSSMVQGEHLRSPVGEEGIGPGFERYAKWFREAGFRYEWVREIFFEGTMRKAFGSEDQKRVFETLRRTPFLILFSLKKE